MGVFRVVTLRHLSAQKLRTLLTVLGVALGVAAVATVSILSRSATVAFNQTVDEIAGRSQIQISTDSGGMPAATWDQVRSVDEVKSGSPAVVSMAASASDPNAVLMVYGVDIQQDQQIREYKLAKGALPRSDQELILGQSAADRLGVQVGSNVKLASPVGVKEFQVSGVIEDAGVGHVNGGQVAVMRLAPAQSFLGLDGQVNVIDLLVHDGADIDRVIKTLRTQVPAGAKVERSASRSDQVDSLLGTFRMLLNVIGLATLVLGIFLVYNSLSVSVTQRRTEIGVLRALGLRREDIRKLVLVESGLIGIVGSVLGFAFALVLAKGLLSVMSQAIGATVMDLAVRQVAVSPVDLMISLGLGAVTGLIAGLIPAEQASRVDPVDAIKNLNRTGPVVTRLATTLSGIGLICAAAGLGYLQRVIERKELSGIAGLVGLIGVVLLLPNLVVLFGRMLAKPLQLLGAEAKLAADGLRARPVRLAFTVGAVLGGLALAIGVAGMIGSMKTSITDWVNQLIGGDLTVSSSPVLAEGPKVEMNYGFHTELERVAGVRNVYSTKTLPIDHNGWRILLYAMDIQEFRQDGKFLFHDGNGQATMDDMASKDLVIVSTTLAKREGLKVGDSIALSTGAGEHAFSVGAIYIDYSSDRGSVVMDRQTYERYWNDTKTGSFNVAVQAGYSPADVARTLQEQFGKDRPLLVQLNRDFKQGLLGRVDQAFQITYALEFVALLIAMLGVFSTVMVSVMERTREIGMLRAVGLTRWRVVKLVLTEAGLIGLIGGLLGVVAGAGVAWLGVSTVTLMYGTQMPYHFPYDQAGQALLLMVLMSLLAGLQPALATLRLDITTAINAE